MRVVVGKRTEQKDAAAIASWVAAYDERIVDLGAGDGRFVRHIARRHPERAAIGVDLEAANLCSASRTATGNASFAVADAVALPDELRGVATEVTILFPWASLLRGLVTGTPGLLTGLGALGNGATPLSMAVNAGALAEAGWSLEEGAARIAAVLRGASITVRTTRSLGQAEIGRWPTTWAKRVAFGRDPRAILIEATLAPPDGVGRAACQTSRARPGRTPTGDLGGPSTPPWGDQHRQRFGLQR